MSSSESDLNRLEKGLAEHEDLCWRICQRAVGNRDDAEDAYQEACISLIRRAGEFRDGTSMRAWVCAYMRRASVDLARRRKRRNTHHEAASTVGERAMSSPVDEASSKEQHALIREAMTSLSEGDREVLELRYYEDFSDAEVAVALEVMPKAANKRVQRALERLRKRLGEGVKLVLLLSFLAESGKADAASSMLPSNLREWRNHTFAALPQTRMSGNERSRITEGVIKMLRNPVTYVVVVAICAAAIVINTSKGSNGGEKQPVSSNADQTADPFFPGETPEKPVDISPDRILPTAGDKKQFTPATEDEISKQAAGNNAFAADMYAKLVAKDTGNLFFSPYSIRTALGMTYAGAKGETSTQIRKALKFNLEDERLHAAFKAVQTRLDTEGEASHTLSIANSLWGQKGYTFLQPFLDTNKTYYGGGLNTLDFIKKTEESRRIINLWVEDKTKQKVKDLIPPNGLSDLTRLVLTNAVYFFGYWGVEFDKDLTKDAPFYVSEDMEVKVRMMRHKTAGVKKKPRFRLLNRPDFQAIELPYKGDEISMVIFLPNEKDGLSKLEKTLDANTLGLCFGYLYCMAPRTDKEVIVYLPRWKMTWGTEDLGPGGLGILPAMGMPDPFIRLKADFSGMNGNRELFIGAVFHKAFVNVNEEGTEAAAATAVAMTKGARMPLSPPVFRADHPFLFVIRDNISGSILFMGRVVNPAE